MNECRKTFQVGYFLSSTFVTYCLLSIATIDYYNEIEQIGFLFFAVMTLISGITAITTIGSILDTTKFSKTYGTQDVDLKPLNTVSSSIMFNEIIVPVTFVAIAFNKSTIATLAIIVIYQFCQYQVFKGDGFMPNLTLELVGIRAYQVTKSSLEGSRLEYVFAKKQWLKTERFGTAVNLTGNDNATIGVIKPTKD